MRYCVLSLILTVALVGCSDDNGPTGPTPDFAGTFLFKAEMADAEHDITCTADGTANIGQSGSTFSGTFTQTGECVGPGGSADNSGSGPISAGRLVGNTMSFEVPSCRYEGTLAGDPPSGASGELTCSILEEGERFDFVGDWFVTLGVASVSVSPDSAGVPLDGTLQLSVALRGPDGEALSGRQVTWLSSDPATGAVDGDGRVTGLGIGSVTITATSVPVYPLEEAAAGEARATVVLRFASVRAGIDHTCGVTTNGRAFCWGWGSDGQLGTGTTEFYEPLPAAVAGGLTFVSVSPGFIHGCGTTTTGSGYGWGSGLGGALGDGTGQSSAVPVAIADGHTFAAVSSGSYFGCGLTTGQAAYCWGSNDTGQLGIGSIGGPYQLSPVGVVGDPSFVQVAVTASPSGGGVHACGVTASGEAFCWGQGTSGELGNGDSQDSGTPVLVAGEHVFAAISAGWGHTCAVRTDGVAYCWGYAISGALGTGSTEPVVQSTPALVTGGHHFESISAGDHYTCGLAVGGLAYCWGSGGPRLGNGETIDRLEPTPVTGGLHFTSISVGSTHTCGMASDGYAYCWGDGSRWQLGTGVQQSKATPTRVGSQ